ncbi:respiratory nitrate reductase subunit gamma [candidate division KSB1 bacterium]|nr:respiratory nitrate reductase subunit gamma [candidate division KSB1 bacterium]
MIDTLLYVFYPYAAFVFAVAFSVYRYVNRSFTYSSLSSQFLENKTLFYGTIPWHYGIIGVLTGHLIGFLIPAKVLAFNSVPLRLYVLEITGFALALAAFVGLIHLIIRRFSHPRIRKVTSPMDIVLLALLLTQVGLGLYVAISYRWGSSWYAASAVPYLRSLFSFNPDVTQVALWPLAVRLHVLGAFTLLAIFPFTRLVHVLVMPFHYLWRPYQKVVWNRERTTILKS